MEQTAFILISLFTLACAVGVVFAKNAVNGAMCLLLCLAGIAGLFIQLHAYLLAFLLVWVYAGAVVALFLFIIMLLDMQGGRQLKIRGVQAAAGLISAVLLVLGLNLLAVRGRLESTPPVGHEVGSRLSLYSYQLLTTYLLPVQVVGFLLLIAMLGVIVLSRRPDTAPTK
ncbi:MAG TPA: NADH-quinone oxidoreductase subunit J [Opitutaceae bacterium]|jgi:NADH-quinone oxidoreductase subunit J|nr:NADH-quinone oxidoreductase subunit J [Opitutaceae bacterium]